MSEAEEPTGPVRSVSQLQSLARCGEAYRLERVVRAPRRQAAWFVQGTAVHEAVVAYERSRRAVPLGEAQRVFEEVWHAELAAARERQPSDSMWMAGGRKSIAQDIEDRFQIGRGQVARYIKDHPPGAFPRPVEIADEPALEVGFLIQFGTVKVLGYIDMIVEYPDGEIRPRDLKTGTKKPSDPYQLATYALAVEDLLGVRPTVGEWWMAKDGQVKPLNVARFTRRAVTDWYQTMDAIARAGKFLGNPGEGCFTCTVAPYCGLARENPLQWPPPEVSSDAREVPNGAGPPGPRHEASADLR